MSAPNNADHLKGGREDLEEQVSFEDHTSLSDEEKQDSETEVASIHEDEETETDRDEKEEESSIGEDLERILK